MGYNWLQDEEEQEDEEVYSKASENWLWNGLMKMEIPNNKGRVAYELQASNSKPQYRYLRSVILNLFVVWNLLIGVFSALRSVYG